MKKMVIFVATACLMGANAPEPESAREQRSFTFDVFLDDSKIGYHEFRLVEQAEGKRRLEAEARFDVKFLFINAFRYRHEIEETWSGDCLVDVQARTNSNGKKTEVEGTLTDSGFLVESGDDERKLGDCVMTFAYWNPEFLNADSLLNPQTGEFLDVEIRRLDRDEVKVSGKTYRAECYEITAKATEVRVCYSADDNRWLALESPAKGGRTLRYELST